MKKCNMENALTKYCSGKGIKVEDLSKMTGVSVPQLYLINSNPLYNVTITTVNKIYIGTKKRYGHGLSANQYLEHECFSK